MIIFRIPQIQRAIATLVLCTFGSGIVTPLAAAAQTNTTPAPTPSTLIPLKGPTTTNSSNNVLLPVGPRSLPGSQLNTAAVTTPTSDPAAAFAAAIASLHELTEQANLKPHPANKAPRPCWPPSTRCARNTKPWLRNSSR